MSLNDDMIADVTRHIAGLSKKVAMVKSEIAETRKRIRSAVRYRHDLDEAEDADDDGVATHWDSEGEQSERDDRVTDELMAIAPILDFDAPEPDDTASLGEQIEDEGLIRAGWDLVTSRPLTEEQATAADAQAAAEAKPKRGRKKAEIVNG